jgi:hypothetical protein
MAKGECSKKSSRNESKQTNQNRLIKKYRKEQNSAKHKIKMLIEKKKK